MNQLLEVGAGTQFQLVDSSKKGRMTTPVISQHHTIIFRVLFRVTAQY